MNHIEGHFPGVRDLSIYYQGWLPEGEVKAILLVVHGLGEHSGRYMNVVNHFIPLGYAVYALDHIGHGKSEGEREMVDSFADFTDTLTIFYDRVVEWQPGVAAGAEKQLGITVVSAAGAAWWKQKGVYIFCTFVNHVYRPWLTEERG